MKTIWSSQGTYQAFYGTTTQTLSLLTACFTDDASCIRGPNIVLVARREDGHFCDLELMLTSPTYDLLTAEFEKFMELARSVNAANSDVACTIAIPLEPRWAFDLAKRRLILAFCSDSPRQIVRLGQNPVWLGLNDSTLALIYLEDILLDENSNLESAWIERHSAPTL